MICMYDRISSDWLEKLQQAGLRPYLWLEGLILIKIYQQAGAVDDPVDPTTKKYYPTIDGPCFVPY